jgi:hypothetical protein
MIYSSEAKWLSKLEHAGGLMVIITKPRRVFRLGDILIGIRTEREIREKG